MLVYLVCLSYVPITWQVFINLVVRQTVRDKITILETSHNSDYFLLQFYNFQHYCTFLEINTCNLEHIFSNVYRHTYVFYLYQVIIYKAFKYE